MSERDRLGEEFAQMTGRFLYDLGAEMGRAFRECLTGYGDLSEVAHIAPYSLNWVDAVPSMLVLRVVLKSGKEEIYGMRN